MSLLFEHQFGRHINCGKIEEFEKYYGIRIHAISKNNSNKAIRHLNTNNDFKL